MSLTFLITTTHGMLIMCYSLYIQYFIEFSQLQGMATIIIYTLWNSELKLSKVKK